MLLKNLTSHTVSVTLAELTGDYKQYSICIMPHGITEVFNSKILHEDHYKDILEIDGHSHAQIVPDPVVVKIEVKDDPISSENLEVTESQDVQEESNDTFVCDICGAEFASARGLNSHKNKVHQ